MSFADSLKDEYPEVKEQKIQERQREMLRKIEEDPHDFLKSITEHIEDVVRNSASIAAKSGQNSISGYFTREIDILGRCQYCLETRYDNLNSHNHVNIFDYAVYMRASRPGFVLIDKIVKLDEYCLVETTHTNLCGETVHRCKNFVQYLGCVEEHGQPVEKKGYLTLSQKVVDNVCAAVCNKIKELGFEKYSVTPRKQELCIREEQQRIFRNPKIVYRPFDMATLLWIEASW